MTWLDWVMAIPIVLIICACITAIVSIIYSVIENKDYGILAVFIIIIWGFFSYIYFEERAK